MHADLRRRTTIITLRGQRLRLAWSFWPGTGREKTWVFIHGMGSSRWAFADLLERNPVSGQYVAVDLPGFGDSQLPRFVQRIEDFREALHALMTHLHLETPVLVGHSFGGMVAGDLARVYPRDVGGLVLVSSAGYFSPLNAMKTSAWTWLNRIGIWVTSADFYGNRTLKALGLDPNSIPPATRRRMRWGWRRAREMARMRQFYDVPQFVSGITRSGVPTVAIHGDHDILFPLPAVLKAVDSSFPVLILPGAGHLPYDYNLEAFTDLLQRAERIIEQKLARL